jgi:hypothetical protein
MLEGVALMSTAFLLIALACACGIAWLIWDARERKPVIRPTVPRNERMPPA